MNRDHLELLKAAVVLAAADGIITPSEKGLMNRLANQVGVGMMSLEAMIDRAKTDPSCRDELFQRSISDPEKAMELLVAAARMDGEIADSEREVLVEIMAKLDIPTDRFSDIYQRGIDKADALRNTRRK